MNLNPFYSSGPSSLFGGLLALLKGSESQHQAQSGALESAGQGNSTPLGESEAASPPFDAILSRLTKALESNRPMDQTEHPEAPEVLADNTENLELQEPTEVPDDLPTVDDLLTVDDPRTVDDPLTVEGGEESELLRAEAGRDVQASVGKDVRVSQGFRIPVEAPLSIEGQQTPLSTEVAGPKIAVNTGENALQQPLSSENSPTLDPTGLPNRNASQDLERGSTPAIVRQPEVRQSLTEQLAGQVSARTESLGQKVSLPALRPQSFAPLSSEVISASKAEPAVQTEPPRAETVLLPLPQSGSSGANRSNSSAAPSEIILPQTGNSASRAPASPVQNPELSIEAGQAKIPTAEVVKASVPETTPIKNITPSQILGPQAAVLELDPPASTSRNGEVLNKAIAVQESNGKEFSISETTARNQGVTRNEPATPNGTAAGNRSVSSTNQSPQHSLSLPENLAVEEALVRTGGDLILNQNKAVAKPERQDLGGDENIRLPQTPQAKPASAVSANSTPVDDPELDSLRAPVDSRSTSQEKAELPQKSIPAVPARVQPSSDTILSKTDPGVVLDRDSGLEIRNASKSTEATGSLPVKSEPLEISSPAAAPKAGGNEALSAGKAQPKQSPELPTVNTRDTSIETSKLKIVDLPPSVSGSPSVIVSPRGQEQAQPTSRPAVQAAALSSDLEPTRNTNPEVSKRSVSVDRSVQDISRAPVSSHPKEDGELPVQQDKVIKQAVRTEPSPAPEPDKNHRSEGPVLARTQSHGDLKTARVETQVELRSSAASDSSRAQNLVSRTEVQGQVLGTPEKPRPESAGQPENGNAKTASPSPRGLSFESTQREAEPLQKTQSANRSFDSNFAEPTVRSDVNREPALASVPAPGEDQQILQNQISSAQSPPVPNQNLGEVQGSSLARLPAEMAALGDLVVKQVSRAVLEGTTKDVSEIRLALHPEALGYLHIILRVEKKGEVFAYMRASSQEASDALTRGIDQLKESLLEKGLELTEFEVSVGDFSLDSGPDSFSFETPNFAQNSGTTASSEEDSSPLLRIPAPTSLLDVLA